MDIHNINDLMDLDKFKHIHLIGIGGVSMSAIAETLKLWGHDITGSDISRTKITDYLQKSRYQCIHWP